jgi:ABC-2 type transport system ATP-binding protein
MMLEIKNLWKKFGKFHALNGLDIMIPEGSLYGFVGPNGAGKTTTIKIMTGLLSADSGQVMINGRDVTGGLEDLKLSIGYVPDFFGVYDNLKVNEYMEFFASCYGLDGLKARNRYMTLLEQVGLEDKANFYVDSLSRGMKQRLCLARALIHDPLLLVLDEPASGLDPRTRFEFKEILKDLKEQGKTIFISSHVLSELSELCTDIGIIDQGKMVLGGSIEEILHRVNATNPLIIAVLGDKERALTILKSQPCVQTIAVKDQDIRVNFIGDEQDEALLLQQLVDAEVLVRGFYREQGSLETLFMQITNHDKEKAVLVHENEPGL